MLATPEAYPPLPTTLQLAKGAYRSAERDAAIDNLIKLAASADFKSKVKSNP